MDCRDDGSSSCSSSGESSSTPRISPLRGGLTQDEIVNQTRAVQSGLSSLRDDHYNILTRIREECENNRNANVLPGEEEEQQQQQPEKEQQQRKAEQDSLLEDRINNVSKSLEQLEIGIEESAVIISLSDHFQRLESDRATLRLEMGRVQDENDWLREELSETQRKLQEALLEITGLREEKKKWEFEEELRNTVLESNVRPVTPSRIPVGSWRVEEEKDINRALNGHDRKLSSSASDRSASPAPSRIPIGGWRAKTSAYTKVMEKESIKAAATATANKNNNKRKYFNLNASRSKIPSR